MDETAPRGRAARLVAVLAVLLGLLAMHGVASAHHAGAAAPVAAHATTAAEPPAAQGGHAHERAEAPRAIVAALLAGALDRPTGPSCDQECVGVTALCVAVLVGAALLLLLARSRAVRLLPSPAPPTARAPAPPVRHARGPDPVRELCVSRT